MIPARPPKSELPFRPLLVLLLLVVLGVWFFDDIAEWFRSRSEPAATGRSAQSLGWQNPLLVGTVSIADIAGKPFRNIPVAVLSGGWVALPVRLCLGGSAWTLKIGSDATQPIRQGLLSETDAVGLWQIESPRRLKTYELAPWNEHIPVQWRSLKPGSSPRSIEIENPRKAGLFATCRLPGGIGLPGVFLQDNRIVGWTFGRALEEGYLWIGALPRAVTDVDEFYRQTVAGGREDYFARVLASVDGAIDDRLRALADGFALSPRLAESDTPRHLQTGSVVRIMRELVDQLVRDGESRTVAQIVDRQVLLEAEDITLLMDVAEAAAAGLGYPEAIRLVEEVGLYIPKSDDPDAVWLDRLHARLYKDWLEGLIEKTELENARQVFETGTRFFPEDPELHLLGVSLALADGSWIEAGDLLNTRSYPDYLSDRVRSLEGRIEEIAEAEEKIVIRFRPGDNVIATRAVLNRSLEMDFIVDTGASMVTIPASVMENLGISIDDDQPLRKVVTAGGEVFAPEIILASIELKGWTVPDVKALVIDIPQRPDVGLLGLNFLDRFRMDLDSEAGLLRLTPR